MASKERIDDNLKQQEANKKLLGLTKTKKVEKLVEKVKKVVKKK